MRQPPHVLTNVIGGTGPVFSPDPTEKVRLLSFRAIYNPQIQGSFAIERPCDPLVGLPMKVKKIEEIRFCVNTRRHDNRVLNPRVPILRQLPPPAPTAL